MPFRPVTLPLENYPEEQFKNSSKVAYFRASYMWKAEAIYIFNHRRMFK